MAKAFLVAPVIQVEAGYRESEMMKSVPGSKWRHATSTWDCPLSWASLAALRGTFGADLEMDDGLIEWAWAERNTRIDLALAVRNQSEPQQPFGFQERGIAFLRAAGSALLGDEMGLGKTRQAILAADLPCLVVCPNSMKYSWRDEWQKWRSDAVVAVVDGTPTAKAKALSSGADVVIVNWESLKSFSRLAPYGSTRLTEKQREPGLLNRSWATVIADEAHRAKDPHSQQTRALWAIGADAKRRIALSGTPVSNSPADLWSLMHFVSPEEYPSRTAFIDRYCVASINFWGGLDVYALKAHMRPELDSFFEPRFLRRQKADVLTQLPAKTYSTRLLTMEPKQAKAYESLRKDMLAALEDSSILATFDPLVQTLRLLQLASAYPQLDADGGVEALTKPSNKLAGLLELVEERDGQPMVVFANSRKLIELCSREIGVEHVLITGAQTPAQRAEAVGQFQVGRTPLALVTLGAGGEGITLTAADTAVFLQRSWSLVQNLQAEDRIHRIGQAAEAVNIIDLVSAGTLEARVHAVMAEKGDMLADAVKDRKILRSLLV